MSARRDDAAAWRAVWAKARAVHATTPAYRARGTATQAGAGPARPEVVPFELVFAAGGRLRLVVEEGANGRDARSARHAAVWGERGRYFAWRVAGGVEELGPDLEPALGRCVLLAPRLEELFALLRGRPLPGAPPEEAAAVRCDALGGARVLAWTSPDGTTRWRAVVAERVGALLELESVVDPGFDLERALAHAAARYGGEQVDGRALERLRRLLADEREQAAVHTLALAPELDVELDEETFRFAPCSTRV